jgi:hypothetical protein
VKKSDNQLI